MVLFKILITNKKSLHLNSDCSDTIHIEIIIRACTTFFILLDSFFVRLKDRQT